MAREKLEDLAEKKRWYSNLEGWVSIVTNTILAALKYWAGISSGSVALVADAWHTLTDSISSLVIIVGARISVKPADEKHPFGHGRFEFISALVVSMMLLLIAYSFFRESLEKFKSMESASYGTFAIVITVVSILGKEALAQFSFWCGRKSDSVALKADGWHHRSDAISSVIILIGIIAGGKVWWMDSLLGALVALIIAYTAFDLAKGTISRILGEMPDDDIVERATEISHRIGGNNAMPHHFHFHDYVTHQELTFHLKFDPEMNIDQAHRLVTTIEKMIHDEMGINATVHIEPARRQNEGKE